MKELAKNESIQELINSAETLKQFKLALPKHLTPERFARIAITAITKTPGLMKCTKESLLTCLLDLSQLGLEPDGRMAHLIPYGDQCTLIIDYKGLVALARRSKEISDVHADVVCAKDIFKYNHGTNASLIHEPAIENRGEPVVAYSFVLLKDGSSSFEVMNKEEIELIHKRSKAAKGPWQTDWKEMAKKTVFRRHSKWLPVSSELFQKVNETDYDSPLDITPSKPEVDMPEQIEKKEPEAIEEPTAEVVNEKKYIDNIEDFNKQEEGKKFDVIGKIFEWQSRKTKSKIKDGKEMGQKDMTEYTVTIGNTDVFINRMGPATKNVVVGDTAILKDVHYSVFNEKVYFWCGEITKAEIK